MGFNCQECKDLFNHANIVIISLLFVIVLEPQKVQRFETIAVYVDT